VPTVIYGWEDSDDTADQQAPGCRTQQLLQGVAAGSNICCPGGFAFERGKSMPDVGSADEGAASEPMTIVARALKSAQNNPFRIGMALGTIITVAIVLLIVQNGESAQLDWLVFHFRAPLWIMLMLTMAAGAVVWEMSKASWHRSRRLRSERLDTLGAFRGINR